MSICNMYILVLIYYKHRPAAAPRRHTSRPAATPRRHTSRPAAAPRRHTSRPAAAPRHTCGPSDYAYILHIYYSMRMNIYMTCIY